MKFLNPFSFSPGPVTFWTTVIYLAVTIPLIYVHEVVPPVPSAHSLKQGLNLSEAWFDLQTITKQYHPYNSRANAEVREYLIKRSQNILDRNGVPYKTETTGGVIWDDKFVHRGYLGVVLLRLLTGITGSNNLLLEMPLTRREPSEPRVPQSSMTAFRT